MIDFKPMAILRFKHNALATYLYIIENTKENKCWLYELANEKEAQALSDRLEINHPECKVLSIFKNVIN